MMISILLADDHPILRQGLRLLLEAEPDFKVVVEAGDGLEAMKLAERFRPNVAVLDLKMPTLNGLEITRQMKQRFSDIRVIILTMHDKEAYVLEALRFGASAYVLKGSDAKDLIHAIRTVMKGERYLSPPLSDRAIEAYLEKAQQAYIDPLDTLTNRQREVLYLAAQGYSNPNIAEVLDISVRTVEIHRYKMMHKLNLDSNTDLIKYALKRGLLSIEDEQDDTE